MRCFSTFFVALFLLAVSVRGEENTAYTALRLIGNLRGEETLKQVLAVSGESGNPQPGMWTIVLDDPAARGGVRELQIVSNQVASERTPVSSDLAGGKTIFVESTFDGLPTGERRCWWERVSRHETPVLSAIRKKSFFR